MSESTSDTTASATPVEPSAGQRLRQARMDRTWDVDTVAARLKVPREKIVWLEGDRWDMLGNPVFVRALAASVCRLLELDPAQVLARLPAVGASPLEGIDEGLKAPFRGHPSRKAPIGLGTRNRLFVGSSAAWRTVAGVVLTGLIIALLWWAWSTWQHDEGVTPSAEPSALPGGVAPVTPATSAAAGAGPSASAPAAATGSGDAAVVSTSEPSWVEVQDGLGQVIFSRVVVPGESLRLEGALPLRLTIGNAQSTRLAFRGQWIDLGAISRDNVAKVELK